MERERAIVEANHARLRPILMTTLMLVFGMLPMALGRGPGAASRASMAKVIIGGQALSLLITLLITPVAYSLFDDLGKSGVVAWLKHHAGTWAGTLRGRVVRIYSRTNGRSGRGT